MLSTFKNLTQLNPELKAVENQLAELRKEGFDEEGTLIVTVMLTIGRLRAEISERQPSLITA